MAREPSEDSERCSPTRTSAQAEGGSRSPPRSCRNTASTRNSAGSAIGATSISRNCPRPATIANSSARASRTAAEALKARPVRPLLRSRPARKARSSPRPASRSTRKTSPKLLADEWTMFGTDAIATDFSRLRRTLEHDSAASAPLRLVPARARQVRPRRETFSAADAVRRMTGLVADHFELKDRGYVRPDHFADLVIVDPHTVSETATWRNPNSYPAGIEQVFVNGREAFSRGVSTGALARPDADTCEIGAVENGLRLGRFECRGIADGAFRRAGLRDGKRISICGSRSMW